MQLSVVILAAGQGKRMNSDLPKVLQSLAGRPLLKHVIDTARRLGPDDLYVVYGHGGAQVQAAMADEHVDWILQAAQLGTGHAVMQAMSVIPDDHAVLVLYGDVPLIRSPTLARLVDAARKGRLAVLTVMQDDPSGYGRIVRGSDGRVRAIVEQKDATRDELAIREVNSGLMAAPARLLREWLLKLGRNNSQREYYLTDVVAGAVQGGHLVEAVEVGNSAEVMGVNDKLQLAEVEARHRRERAESLMLAGATVVDPARIDVRGEVEVGRNVFIDVNVVLAGLVRLETGVKIGPGCVISDSRIGAHTEIFAHSLVDRAEVGRNCRIGPYGRVRPDSRLADDVHVGNFVEIKGSEMGTGSKANHLTYIGDARIGAHVNVGAGSVTCNYDGLNKWPTVIEDRVFIGSGSMLVAPVRIGAGATIGAGSTITQSAPAGELTLTRARQITIPGWRRPHKHSESEKKATIEERMKASAAAQGQRPTAQGQRPTRAPAVARPPRPAKSSARHAKGAAAKVTQVPAPKSTRAAAPKRLLAAGPKRAQASGRKPAPRSTSRIKSR